MKSIRLSTIIISFCSLFIFESCNVIDEIKKELYVKISTEDVSQVSYTIAIAGGNVIDDGGKAVTEKGICYSTTPGPTTGSGKISLGTGMGPFSGVLQKLTDNTTYYYKAYCINALGTSYGEEKSFTTQNASLPTVVTNPATDVQTNQFTISLKVASDGGSTLIGSGFYYSMNPTISLADKIINVNNSYNINTAYSATITGLTEGTTYYIAAFSRNGKGIQLGNTIAVKTSISPIKIGLSNGLQVFYPFDGNANDVSGNQKNGVVYNAKLVADRYGYANSAYSFDGVEGTKIQTTYPGVLGNSSRSISIWSRRPLQAFNGSFLLTWGTQVQGQSFGLFMSGRDKTQFFGVDTGGSAAQTIFNSLWDGNWHHYVVVYDKNQGQNILNIKMYIDGKYYPIIENWNPQNFNTIQGINMVIGEYSAAQNDWRTTNGELDDLGVWNRALSETEIQYLFANNYKP
jgi:hypothetical protein